MVFHYWWFLDKDDIYETAAYNGYHDVLMMAFGFGKYHKTK